MNDMTNNGTEVSRRGFLTGVGGLTFCFALGTDGVRLVPGTGAHASAAARAINPWVRIAPDGIVTIYSAGAEMGQGSMTSLPLIVAEEMDADWSKVVIEFAPADAQTYGYGSGNAKSMAIVGSRAVQMYYTDLRLAGAQVRKVLLANAAARWKVEPASLKTEPGFVVNTASGQRLSYGEIASFGTLPASLPAVSEGDLKKRSEFRLIGRTVPRRDIPAKVDGTAQFAIDVHLPGMLYASTRHCPVHGSVPESWNVAKVKGMKGVVATVRLPDGVAVVANSFAHAMAARQALEVVWKKGAKAEGFDSERALTEHYVQVHHDPNAKAQSLDAKGDVKAAFSGAAKTFKAEYRSDYGYHAQMEPLNAVARFNPSGDALEIWDGSQAPDRVREDVAKAAGLKLEQVTVHQCYMGGGFGRRSLGDYASEAALVAKATGKPIKLIWTREEDIAYGMFRPQSFQCLEAALDAGGKVTGWRHCVVGDGGGLLTTGVRIPYYAVPNQDIELRGTSHGIRLKHWRAVGHVFNVFAIESFVDEMARAENMDPVDFRLQRMSITPRAKAAFERVAAMSNWKAPRPEGRALGISITERSRSLGAGVVEISLDRRSGKIRVHKVWVAVDGGTIVQPDAARANVESGIMYGLSSVLHERVTVKGGVVEQSNFHDYHVMRMSDTPEEVHVEFLDKDTHPGGLGEIGNPFIAGAVANAFFVLTGKRLRHMPFTPERVLATLKA
jgi:isoquinoline 1-oxidoreductase beta subunit